MEKERERDEEPLRFFVCPFDGELVAIAFVYTIVLYKDELR